MKIAKSRLKQIIKEEFDAVNKMRALMGEELGSEGGLESVSLEKIFERIEDVVSDPKIRPEEKEERVLGLIELARDIAPAEESSSTFTEGEIEAQPEQGGESPQPARKDVSLLIKYISKINHPQEYAELLSAVLKWGASGKVPQITKSLQIVSQGNNTFYQALLRHLKLLKRGGG
jgi:hypothetical protein